MARLFSNGVELNSTGGNVEFTAISGAAVQPNSPGFLRSGAYCAQAAPVNSTAASTFRQHFAAANINVVFVRAFFYIWSAFGNPNVDTTIFMLNDGNDFTTPLLYAKLTSTGTITLFDEDGQIGSASSALAQDTWHMLEFKFDRSAASGSHVMEGKINGDVFATASNRAVGAGVQYCNWGCNMLSEGANAGAFYFDDMAINDNSGSFQNSYPGLGKLAVSRPNAAGDVNTFATQTGGTAGAANNFTRVDEVTPNDATDFNGSSTLNQEDMFNFDNFSTIGANDIINCVHLNARFRNSTADTTAAITFSIIKTSGGTKSSSSAFVPNSVTWRSNQSADPRTAVITLYADPDGNPWTLTTLNSLQAGYKLTTAPAVGGRRIDVSYLNVTVDYTPVTQQTIQGQARIAGDTLRTVLGRARITATTLRTILGKAKITPFYFGLEDFEGGIPGLFDSVATRYGNGTATLDTTSKLSGTNSVKILTTNSGGDTAANAQKDFNVGLSEIYVQFKLRLASGFSFGPNGYLGLFALRTAADADVVYCNMENYGSPQFVPSGPVIGYRPSGVNIAANTVYKIEFRFKVSATVGNFSIWVNNDVVGSADFNTGNINTGTTNFQKLVIGNTYCPDTTGDYYIDDIVADTSFIGGRSAGSITTTQTILGRSRIEKSVSQTVLGRARVTVSALQTILGRSRITKSVTQTILGRADILKSTTQTILGRADILKSATQTILGRARIALVSPQTILGRARITASTTQTVTGRARITVTTARTITGIADILKSTSRTIQGIARIQYTTPQTIQGKARVEKSVLQTILGRARITISTAQTILGKADILKSTTQNITGIATLSGASSQTILGRARITALGVQTILGRARIQKSVAQTILGRARIALITSQTILGRARITASTSQTITGKSRIQKSVTQTILGRARIALVSSQTILGRSRITKVVTQTILGVARITTSTSRTILGKARITISTTQNILGRSRITTSTQQTILGRSRIEKVVLQTIQGLARINTVVIRTITGKASILKSTARTILGRARIISITTRNISGKAYIIVPIVLRKPFIQEICSYIESQSAGRFTFGPGGNLIIGTAPKDFMGIVVTSQPSPDPDLYTGVREYIIEFNSINKNSDICYDDLRFIYKLLHRAYAYNTDNYHIYLGEATNQIRDQDRDSMNRKNFAFSILFTVYNLNS